LENDESVLSDFVGSPAREKALAAMLPMLKQKRRLRKRSQGAGSSISTDADTAGDPGDPELVGGTASGSASYDGRSDDIETELADTGSEAGSVSDEIHATDLPVGETDDIEESDCEQCTVCMESFTNPVVYLLKL
jgi:hypothetical protein